MRLVPVMALALAATQAHADGPPDRSAITSFMLASKMQIKDYNGDGGISDIDVSLMIDDRLREVYGADISVPDLDHDGSVTGSDVVLAIAQAISGCFGKVTDPSTPVSGVDILEVYNLLLDGSPKADINFDGVKDIQDLLDTASLFGNSVSPQDVIDIASQLFNYVGAIHERGRDSYMATELASKDHMEGISNTWPYVHPDWWRENHLTSVSWSYDPAPPSHAEQPSRTHSYPPTHQEVVSKRYPPNHDKDVSATWLPPPPPPPTHWWFDSRDNNYPPPQSGHRESVRASNRIVDRAF
jgi:hypothetical protein